MRRIFLSASILATLAIGCARPYGEFSEAECRDGVDNDLNGMIDCDDHGRAGNCCGVVQCGQETYCGALEAADGGVPLATCEATPGFCNDGVDNDGDRLADAHDPDCCGFTDGGCATSPSGRCPDLERDGGP
jgi:hypothetical protein